ncbi:radical SAM protein [Proteiniborus sp. MB09-C3]|uniref:radical SAM protein n=1 Tax=Proteiniborus sp. MB09-C3 TaxID=3050072 RepID=UPI0025564482|nr:radical SAM protein [Proteiniborus sp. MB09-C3]WIV12639.1 radical SAM protein [Proteiniborus sp. MB09-C3]
MLNDIMNMPDKELFLKAQEIGLGKTRINTGPVVITGECLTQPHCNHCKWDSFKMRNNQFSQKSSLETAIERGKLMESIGVNRVFTASGWMGYTVPDDYPYYIEALKNNTNMEVFGLFGAIDKESLKILKSAGMDGYQCGIESPNENIYKRFRPGGDTLEDRLKTLHYVKDLGLKVWSGFLVGLGEEKEDVIKGLQILKDLEPESLSILPFTPYPFTNMMAENPANPLHWARTVAQAHVYIPTANVFSDMKVGFYGEYSVLTGANGSYIFPKKS